MKERYEGGDYPAVHVEASKRYFADAFPEDLETSESFGSRRITPDFDVTFGVTHSEDFQVAAIAVDVRVLNEPGFLEFARLPDEKDVLITCC